jgi:hypothetical protein
MLKPLINKISKLKSMQKLFNDCSNHAKGLSFQNSPRYNMKAIVKAILP